jgi:hypothetical protein
MKNKNGDEKMNKKIVIYMLSMLVLTSLIVKIPVAQSQDDIATNYEDDSLTEIEIESMIDSNLEQSVAPDLTVLSQVCVSNDGGNTWRIEAAVKNIGTGYAIPDYTYFFTDFEQPEQVCQGRFFHGLGFAPGATKYPFSVLFEASGSTLVTTFADYLDWVEEGANENNNELTQYINL